MDTLYIHTLKILDELLSSPEPDLTYSEFFTPLERYQFSRFFFKHSQFCDYQEKLFILSHRSYSTVKSLSICYLFIYFLSFFNVEWIFIDYFCQFIAVFIVVIIPTVINSFSDICLLNKLSKT